MHFIFSIVTDAASCELVRISKFNKPSSIILFPESNSDIGKLIIF